MFVKSPSKGTPMPRATWNGHLRLSLVSCPVYLSPATTETKRIRLNQINAATGNRVRQQLVDEDTGEVVERSPRDTSTNAASTC